MYHLFKTEDDLLFDVVSPITPSYEMIRFYFCEKSRHSFPKMCFREYPKTRHLLNTTKYRTISTVFIDLFLLSMQIMNILVSGNLDSGILETDIPDERNSLISLFTPYQVVRYCQSQSRLAVL